MSLVVDSESVRPTKRLIDNALLHRSIKSTTSDVWRETPVSPEQVAEVMKAHKKLNNLHILAVSEHNLQYQIWESLTLYICEESQF